jgi:2-aminoethylphosphonate-pyruvate transaminase
VRDRGFIYPGKLTAVDTFRVGCIGAIGPNALRRAVAAIADVLQEMGVRRIAP